MLTSLAGRTGAENYPLLTQVIVPRPIAWVVTENDDAAQSRWNIAPFSYFNGVASAPPLVMFSVGVGQSGGAKDTLHNLRQRPLHTIALPHAAQMDEVQATAATLTPGASEFEHAGVRAEDWEWHTPRPGGSRVALGCEVHRIFDVVPDEQTMVIARIELVWIDDEVVSSDAKGRITVDPATLDPLGRLGAGLYASIGPARRPGDRST